MPDQFFSPEGDLEDYFVTDYWLIDQYIGDQLWTWGYNYNSNLGINVTTSTSVRTTPVTTFAGGTNWRQVDCALTNSFGIKSDGTLWIWGYNGAYYSGSNFPINQDIPTPITTLIGGTDWKQVSGGNYHAAAIKTDGTLWTWGDNGTGQLGRFSDSLNTPVTTFAGGTNWSDTATTNPEDLYTFSVGGGGSTHSAAIKTDGTLWLWGYSYSGQLGNNAVGWILTPITTFAGGTNWRQVSGGTRSTAAIKTDGTLWIWGSGSSGQLGTNDITPTRSTPVTTFAGGTNWKQVSTSPSNGNVAAVKTDGTLWVWGNNSLYTLGTNDSINRSTPVTTFAGGTTWKHVSTNSDVTAAVKTDGTLWVWGSGNVDGTLGTNDTSNKLTPVTTFAGGTTWKQVSVGSDHMVAVKTDGTLWTWGDGSSGQLGRKDTPARKETPVTTFAGGTNWSDTATTNPEDLYTISGGGDTSAAIKTDGTLWVWGNNGFVSVGNASTITTSSPATTFAGGTTWKQVSLGNASSAAIKTDGTLWVWGSGSLGQLGNGSITGFVSTPITTFAGGTTWKQVHSSIGACKIAIKTDGTLWTWGVNSNGQLGNASTVNTSTPVTTFSGGTNWKQVTCSGTHSAAVKTDGTLWVWGSNSTAKLGNAAAPAFNASTPVTTFSGGTNWKQVSANSSNTSAVKTDGTLWVWGASGGGHLGNASIIGNISTPITTFAGGTNWKQVSVGVSGMVAVKTDGTLWTWGSNAAGQLGDNTNTFKSTPVTTFAGGTTWKQASAGDSHIVALQDDGVNKRLYLWGSSRAGQLGDLLNYLNKIPTTPFGGGALTWKQASAGGTYTAAVKTDGTLWTWGSNSSGQLGNKGLLTAAGNVSTPITTFAGGTTWKQVFAGPSTIMALQDDGVNKRLYAWGGNTDGQLGVNISPYFPGEVFGETSDWVQVACGTDHTSAIKTDGTLWTWGSHNNGALGIGGLIGGVSETPVTTFAGGTNWKQVASNTGSYHTAAIKTDGTLWVWGDSDRGSLGINDTAGINASTPMTTFAGGTNWKQVAVSRAVTAAIKTDGTLWAWGRKGTLGINDSVNPRYTPVTTFAGGTNWKQVACGYEFISAIKTDGTLWGTGWEYYAALGTPNPLGSSGRFTPVTTFAGGTDWKQVACAYYYPLALKSGINGNYPLT